jgi:hypothetical protein
MTAQELRNHPTGVIEERKLKVGNKGVTDEATYYLGKREKSYFLAYSEDGSYCFRTVSETGMLKMINDENASKNLALDIYATSPQLSGWMD